LARTNKRVQELNYYIRSLLVGKRDGKVFYQSGDQILTLSPIAHMITSDEGYDIGASNRGDLEVSTSTLIELGEEVFEGDYIQYNSGGKAYSVRLREGAFSYKAATGNTFNRQWYRYRMAYTSGEFTRKMGISLISPDQMARWKIDCEILLDRARVTQSRGKTTKTKRGQAGDHAKAIWKERGMKNWFKWADGTAISEGQYKEIRRQLWSDYWSLVNFADNASFAYCSTVHRVQGITCDVIVVDTKNLLDDSFAQYRSAEKEDTFDPRKSLYTAATRASKQVVFMD
jgi:hypothetical protein